MWELWKAAGLDDFNAPEAESCSFVVRQPQCSQEINHDAQWHRRASYQIDLPAFLMLVNARDLKPSSHI